MRTYAWVVVWHNTQFSQKCSWGGFAEQTTPEELVSRGRDLFTNEKYADAERLFRRKASIGSIGITREPKQITFCVPLFELRYISIIWGGSSEKKDRGSSGIDPQQSRSLVYFMFMVLVDLCTWCRTCLFLSLLEASGGRLQIRSPPSIHLLYWLIIYIYMKSWL